MKKIVGILTVAAVLATSVFAADVSATSKFAGSLFNYDADGNVSAFNLADDDVANHKPALALSVNGDKAGASIKYLNTYVKKDGTTSNFKLGDHSLWFAPLDSLKITLGNSDKALNQEKIDWCNTDMNVAGYGFKIDFTMDAFSASVQMYPGEAANDDGNAVIGNYWFTKDNVAQTAISLGYAADFGTIGAFADFEANFKNIALALGYSGAAGGTSYFANAVIYMNDGLSSIRGEAYVQTSFDSIGLSVFIPMTYVMKQANAWEVCGNKWHKGGLGYGALKDGQIILGTTAKLTFPVSTLNGSLYIACNDWLADGLSVNVKPGIAGSCGSMGWETYLNMNIAKGSFTLDVPFVVTLGF